MHPEDSPGPLCGNLERTGTSAPRARVTVSRMIRAISLCLVLVATMLALAGCSHGAAVTSASRQIGNDGLTFVTASARLSAACRTTAQAVGYPSPCPMRVPVGLARFGGRPGCELDIIGPAKPCPNTVFSWRGWIVGSSTATNEHLVLTASPRPLADYAKVVNGPAWSRGARVRLLGWVSLNGWHMREVFVPAASNDGSAFADHVVLIWTVAGHTYGVGFHNVHGIRATLALDVALARSIKLVHS
jgi:hypothetical protein